MSNIDISLSRILLNNYDSGIYTVASTFSKIPLYLTLALLYVLFPEIKTGEKNYKILLTSISFIFSINVVLIFCFYIFGDLIISYLYGDRYLDVIKYVLILLPSFTLLNISNIMMIYFTKNHKSHHLLIFLIYSVPFMIFTFRYVDNLLNLSYFIFLYNLIFFIINLTLYFTTNRK
tara:strand:- start:252 stop:779 length:528 start_codon:yes stop_codon:yes gene_type:complete